MFGVTGWRSAPICLVNGDRIVDDRDEVLALAPRPGLRETLTGMLRRDPVPPVTAPDGTPLFSYETKIGRFKNRLTVFDPDHRPIVRIDQVGNLFTTMKRRYTIHDASGAEIGRIDNPRLGREFVVLDGDGATVAKGIKRDQDGWEVIRSAVRDSPWPELVAAFFMSGIGIVRQGASV